jgi:hypothetical protein
MKMSDFADAGKTKPNKANFKATAPLNPFWLLLLFALSII